MPRIIGITELGKTTFLRTLVPFYNQALKEDKLDQFFDNLIVVWLDRYPIDDACDPFFLGDPEYYEWATRHIKAVSFMFTHYIAFTIIYTLYFIGHQKTAYKHLSMELSSGTRRLELGG